MTYYSWACGTATTDVLALASATNGNNDPDPVPTSENVLNIPGLTSNFVLPTYPSTSGQTGSGGNVNSVSNTPSTSGSQKSLLSTTAIAFICLAGVLLIISLAVGGYCLRKRHTNRKNQLVDPPPIRMPYQPTVTHGSIYSWTQGVANSAPSSTFSGPTANNYALSEMSYGFRR